MPDFNIRSESIDVEQVMEQIRARIRDKRGVDYTEQQIRELAAVKLEKLIDPRGVGSDLLERFRRVRAEQEPAPNYVFEEATLYESHRAPIRWIRRLLQPVLKLFFNPNPLIQALNIQSRLNTMQAQRRELDDLYFEVIHNLVVEMTRLSIEVKNLKMRVESVASRLEFNERRARALESAVVYRPSSESASEPSASPPPVPRTGLPSGAPPQTMPSATIGPPSTAPPASSIGGGQGEGPGQRSRRRRRRRGRRGGGSMAARFGSPQVPSADAVPQDQSELHDDPVQLAETVVIEPDPGDPQRKAASETPETPS